MFTFIRSFSSQTNRYALKSINSLKNSATDLNNTKLIGTMSSDVFCNAANKTKIFHLRTFNQDKFYDSHTVILTPYMIENLPAIPKTYQNLFVTGKIRTESFITNNGKRGTSIHVVAKQIYLWDNKEPILTKISSEIENGDTNVTSTSDGILEVKNPNTVELLAHICFDILNEMKHSVFTVALHYGTKNSDGMDVDRTDFVSVFVYNETLCNIVRNQLKRLDRVRIEGVLKYKACVDDTGKKRYKGFVVATKISKVIPLRQIEVQSNIYRQTA